MPLIDRMRKPKKAEDEQVVQGKQAVQGDANIAKVAHDAVVSGNAEAALGVDLNHKERRQVAQDIRSLSRREKEKLAPSKEDASVASKFKDALLAFTPQLVGAAIGGVFEGTEGAVAGAEEGAKAGQVLKDIDAQKAKAEKDAQELALKQEQVETDARMADISGQKLAADIESDIAKEEIAMAKTRAKADKVKNRLDSLKGEDKKVVTFTMQADRALNQMQDALNSGSNTFEVVGTDVFTDARDRFINSMLRRESGAAISDEEYERFKNFVPMPTDSKEQQIEKMKRNRQNIDDSLHVYQLNRDDLKLPKPISAMSIADKRARIAELRKKRGL